MLHQRVADEEGAAKKHMAQVQHNMWLTNPTLAVLSFLF
jgi:hypothetical protein